MIRTSYEWGDIDEEEWEAHYTEVEAANVPIDEAHRQAIEEWQASIDRWRSERSASDATFEAAVVERERLLEVWERRHADAEAVRERWIETHDRVFGRWSEDIGVLVGDIKDAFPRGVNGYPMFSACRTIHREDWERARKAIDLEEERRKEIPV